MKSLWRLSWLCLLPWCAATVHLQAQETTASIVGTVVDASGSPVPSAKVDIISEDRNLTVRTVTTSTEGEFTATLLPIGTYSVKATAQGFKSEVQKGVELHVSDKATVTLKLEVGAVSETVTVEASAVSVELQSAQSGSVITGSEVRELALNNRNYLQLVSLMPGVVSNAPTDELFVGTTNPLGSTNTIPFSINGGRTSGNNFMIDGADNVDRGSNLTLLNYPSVESIGEFKVLRGQYSAEYGRGATGQINVMTRSGSSKFHGSAYEFFRNDKLAANNYFNNSRGLAIPPLRYNNFGYSVGGPIPIGSKSRQTNRTFFFWSHEFRRIITYSTFLATVPTADMKNGIFPTPVCVQRNGSTCLATDTKITNISPLAKAYLQDIFSKVPAGDPGTFSLVTAQRNLYNTRQELVKIDHTFNQKHSAYVRFINDTIPTTEPGGLFTGATVPGVAVTNTNSPGRN